MSGYVVNQRLRTLTGSRWEIMYIASRIHDSNEFSMTIPMFSELSYAIEIKKLLYDNTRIGKLMMAAFKPFKRLNFRSFLIY